MQANKIRQFLSGNESPIATLTFLEHKFIPAVVGRLNDPITRSRMALYGGDRIPENERNLTDVRNRVSLLVEYSLGWIGNDVLKAHGITDLFWTNVVANRFPDLELRNSQGHRGVRIEVKCIQAIAEEKSANFDTLKKDLDPNTDYIVVFVWEWCKDQTMVGWDRAPKVLRAFVFHASSLASLRDYNWLQNPPKTLGDGFQGFDFRYAVNCRQGIYNEEEGNYGKLLRIWSDNIEYHPGLDDVLQSTIKIYREFKEFTIWSGFEVLAQDLLSRFGPGQPELMKIDGKIVGYCAGDRAIVLRQHVKPQELRRLLARPHHSSVIFEGLQRRRELVESSQLSSIVVMNDKYQWVEECLIDGELERRSEGRKPKHLARHLSES